MFGGKKEEEAPTDQYSRLLFSLLMTKVEYDSAKPQVGLTILEPFFNFTLKDSALLMQESYWNGLGSFIWDLLAMLLGMVKEYDSSMRYGTGLTLLKELWSCI